MNGYMDLFLETGNPAFYMMAKQENVDATLSSAANRSENLSAREEASPR